MTSKRPELASLHERRFDVAVIGAGINGCAAAQELSAAGYAVLLVDQGDFGAGSSSRSSRLIHCGLRYLAPGGSPYEFLWHPGRFLTALRMTRKAMQARSEFVRTAPGRTRKLRFGFPVWDGMPYRPWHVDAGLRIVEAMGPKDVPLEREVYSPAELDRVPLFRDLRDRDRLLAVHAFTEYQFDWPERIAMDMALDAERMGAVCRNYTPVVGLRRVPDGGYEVDLQSAEPRAERATVTAKAVLNTAGIWIDRVHRLTAQNVERKILGTKGAHIVLRLPEEYRGHGVMTLNREMLEPVYLIPWRQGLHYMGVTETVYEGDIDDIRASEEDVQWLLEELNHLLPSLGVEREDILYTWAGVRPLTFDPALPKGARSREIHDLAASGLPGMFAMTAGPVTTHRSAGRELCESVAAHVVPSGPRHTPDYAAKPMANDESSPALLNHYDAIRLADLKHVAANEHVTSLRDLLARRTGLLWTETCGRDGARRAAQEVADILDWDEERIETEIEDYLAYVEHTHWRPSGKEP